MTYGGPERRVAQVDLSTAIDELKRLNASVMQLSVRLDALSDKAVPREELHDRLQTQRREIKFRVLLTMAALAVILVTNAIQIRYHVNTTSSENRCTVRVLRKAYPPTATVDNVVQEYDDCVDQGGP